MCNNSEFDRVREASRGTVKDGVVEEQEGDDYEAIGDGGVNGVKVEGSIVILIGDHFVLKRNQISELNCGKQSERR